jgi:hypothetical protein
LVVFTEMVVRILISIAVAIASAILGAWVFLFTVAGLLVGGGPGGGLLPLVATFGIAFIFAVAGFVICFGWLGKRFTRVRTNATQSGSAADR